MESEARKELEATVEARKELGPEHDDQLIAGFLDRIEKEIDRRVDERLAKRGTHRGPPAKEELGIAIPIVIVAGIFAGAAGVFAALALVAVIFLVLTVSRR